MSEQGRRREIEAWKILASKLETASAEKTL
jgi:hypothetical protein